jgi:CRP-like cAMP-binding protein
MRTHKENATTAKILKSIKFIKEQNLPEKNLQDLAQCLQLLEMDKGEIVFDYDSLGDLFYIILTGSVSVLIPDKSRLTQS